MKSSMKLGSVLIVLVLLLGILIPNLIIDHALAKGGGSTIGGISVKGLADEDIEAALQEAINTWRETPISVNGAGVKAKIDPALFTFDVASSVADYHHLTDKSWYAFWQSKKTVHLPLHVSADDRVKAQLEETGVWEAESTLNEVVSNATYLKNHEIEAKVADTSAMEAERIALSIEDIPTNATDVLELVNSLNDAIIAPNEPFSLLTALGEKSENITSESLNFVASNIYHTALQTEYEIIERHAQKTVPSYLQQGLDARVNRALDKDLQFINRSDQPNKLKITVEGDSLKVELLAQKKVKEISVRVSKDKIIQPRVITRYSKDLSIGREEVLQKGQEGVRVEVYRSILENGNTTEELVSRDYYPPVNKIIVKSSRQSIVPENSSGKKGTSDSNDPDLHLDLDGDGLPDSRSENKKLDNNAAKTDQDTSVNANTSKDPNDPEIVYGYYDKGGDFIQTSP
ncbi:VanW family protein [Lysinibacillus xylanilyticus]|uniref:VanW family protein n=1 Tax=Lysinibacillus xylanilyticus TaxID=582475 RepID=UPI002B251188|nr:VanW family protein [Lysinibacillus xylanilyticus]MEB2302762.1 VanW family protein [Lysinibacillus xylanilyticus]